MAIYSLHEMAGLLKTGLWQGGEVEKLGYIGTAVPHASPAPACGLTGVYISYDTMLERCEVSMQGGGCELFISQYHPYTGTYMTYVLESNLSTGDYFWLSWRRYWQTGGIPTYGRITCTKEIHSASSAGMTQDIVVCGAVE